MVSLHSNRSPNKIFPSSHTPTQTPSCTTQFYNSLCLQLGRQLVVGLWREGPHLYSWQIFGQLELGCLGFLLPFITRLGVQKEVVLKELLYSRQTLPHPILQGQLSLHRAIIVTSFLPEEPQLARWHGLNTVEDFCVQSSQRRHLSQVRLAVKQVRKIRNKTLYQTVLSYHT